MIGKTILTIFFIIWELPQTVIGAIFFLIFYSFREKIVIQNECIYTYIFKRYPGMSLGRFIFLMRSPEKNYKYEFMGITRDHDDLVAHELGHSIQSKILGPLYLAVIFTSGLWFLFTSLIELILQRRFVDYYGFYTEYWADALGDVKNRSRWKARG